MVYKSKTCHLMHLQKVANGRNKVKKDHLTIAKIKPLTGSV